MKKTIGLLLALVIVVVSLRGDETQGILERIDAFRIPYSDFLIQVRITSYERDKVKEEALFDSYISGDDRSLVIAREYKTRGMKILYVKENMWVHLPNTHRPIRITPIQRLMGEASNGDIARVGFGEDYDAELIEETDHDGVPCARVLLKARTESSTYARIILTVHRRDYRPLRAEFFLLSGKHFKTATYDEYSPIAGKLILTRMTIRDEVRRSRWTVLEYERIEQKSIPDRYFNKNYLVHVRDLK